MLNSINYNLDPNWINRKPYHKSFPVGFQKDWTNGMNGLAFGPEGNAFVTTREKLYKFPVPKHYHKWYEYGPEASSLPYPKGLFDHAGDLDVDSNGNIWIPIEGSAGPAIAKFNSDLEFEWYYKLDRQQFASWVASDNEFLYSSDFHSNYINVYKPTSNYIDYVGQLNLSEKVFRIQGGAFYKDKLYLCSDDVDNPRIVSVKDGNVTTEVTIPRVAFNWVNKTINWFARDDVSRYQELQGIAFKNNELQVILGEINWFTKDDLILLHYNVS